MKKWILLIALCGALGVWLVFHFDPAALEPFRMSFLTVIFTITTFSVTFSISGFNAAPYRQFHRTVAPRLLAGSVTLLLLALAPLVLLVIQPRIFVPSCLIALPVLMVAGAVLQEVGRQETDPVVLLDRVCSLRTLGQHLQSLAPQIDQRILETKALQLSKPGDRPGHESGWYLPVPGKRDDPLTKLSTLGLLAIQQGDIFSFARVIGRFLEVLELTDALKLPATTTSEYTIRAELRSFAFDALQRNMLALQRDKGTASLARAAIDTLAAYAVGKTRDRRQTDNLVFSALHLIETLARHCYTSGAEEETRVPLIVARQLVQKGMDDPPQPEEAGKFSMRAAEFHHTLPQLTRVIQRMGTFAIEQDDGNLLYRCFDAFGWLGCAAVRQEELAVGTACLRALSQLGREVRAKGMECFWDKCPLRPEDHAEERIDWMASWLSKIPAEQRSRWAELFGCAYSRLSGKDVELQMATDGDGQLALTKSTGTKNHVEQYAMRAGSRNVDYSDFTFLKDLELHGKGMMMQGPLVPLSGM